MNPSLAQPVRVLLLMLAVLIAGPTIASCLDESTIEPYVANEPPEAAEAKTHRVQLLSLVHEAVNRSNSFGAAKVLAEAAASDVEEASAGASPQLSLSGNSGPSGSNLNGVSNGSGLQTSATVSLSAPLFDHGRVARLTSWRSHLAEAARQGQISSQEQIGLQTVSLVIERARYSVQAQVFQQYASKMGCLVSALEQITSVDKGRASELVQARKTRQQAELSYAQALSSLLQVETRLRRFVGDDLPGTEGISSPLLSLPPVADTVADAEHANEIAQLEAQASATESFASALVAGQKPQFNWNFSGSKAEGPARSGSWGVGVSFNIPLINPANEPAARASQRRAVAARLQYEDALQSRKYRVLEVHEQASSAFGRARQVVEVLRDSDLVRQSTLQQWHQLGRRSLFDVMSAEGEYYSLRVAYVNALYDGEQSVALLWSLGRGVTPWLE